jgi:hypothetical protein
MLGSMDDPMTKAIEFLGGAFMDVKVNPGTFRIVSVAARAISSLDQPFICEVVARRIGMSLVSVKPDYEYLGRTDEGDLVHRDQQFEARMNEAMAQGATELANSIPWIQPFSVTPQGGDRFKLTLQQQLIALSREYSVLIDIR